jgi:hypothetical protein
VTPVIRVRALAAALGLCSALPASAADASVEEEVPPVSVGADALYFRPREGWGYLYGSVRADADVLHLEVRYNYEDLHTGSAFVGWNLGVGERLRLELTPMLGGVLGATQGVAPALELALSYGKLALWSESEYVLARSDADFFYSWTELSLWPVEWARAGVNVQWTRSTGARPVAERGFHLGLAYRNVSVAAYVFEPGGDDASTIFLFGLEL